MLPERKQSFELGLKSEMQQHWTTQQQRLKKRQYCSLRQQH
jgi:hypothetical protein